MQTNPAAQQKKNVKRSDSPMKLVQQVRKKFTVGRICKKAKP